MKIILGSNQTVTEEDFENNPNVRWKCSYCGELFKHNTHMYRHQKYHCKLNPDVPILKKIREAIELDKQSKNRQMEEKVTGLTGPTGPTEPTEPTEPKKTVVIKKIIKPVVQPVHQWFNHQFSRRL